MNNGIEIDAKTGEAYQVDVTDSASVNEAVDAVIARHGRVDILINNSGGRIRAQGSAHGHRRDLGQGTA